MEFAPAGAKGEDTAVNKESNCQAEKDVFLPRCLTLKPPLLKKSAIGKARPGRK